MGSKTYCAYNWTNESVLSLGVTRDGGIITWVNELLRPAPKCGNEGRWLTRFGLRTLGLFESRDLIYLDKMFNVVATEERFPALRMAPSRAGMTSILELPAGSIASTLTRTGHQLEICAVEDMEFRLRSAPAPRTPSSFENIDRGGARGYQDARRFSRRVRWPRLVAYQSEGGSLTVHRVRDIGLGGLYLLTDERWPLGAHVRMTLQREGGVKEHSATPVSTDLRVARWEEDGMGLEFVQTTPEQAAILAMQVL